MSDTPKPRPGGPLGAGTPPLPSGAAPPTPRSAIDLLMELDVPTAMPAPAPAEPAGRKRSTLEFLTSLDIPARPSSHDDALGGEALSEANAPAVEIPAPSAATERTIESVRPLFGGAEPEVREPPPASPADAGLDREDGERTAAGTDPAGREPIARGDDVTAATAAPEFSTAADTAEDTGRPRFSWEPAAPPGTPDARADAHGEAESPRFSWETRGDGAAMPPASAVPERRIELGPRPVPKPVEETIEERRQRLGVRVHTCRDAFRLMGFLGIGDESRHAVARGLITVEERMTADRPADAEHEPMKTPEHFLHDAPRGKVDQIDRALTDVEDKLLALDDQVPPATFRSRVEGKNHSRTVIARYARLLASRNFPAGQRRDRFEWLALKLLTTRETDGTLTMLPKDRARVVLQHLIGGMPGRTIPDEEAVKQLQESIAKLDEIPNAQEFFDSGFYLDAHGYKVSMRDQLLIPDFLYLSVAFSAKVENRLEHWIGAIEGERGESPRVTGSETREGIRRLLEEQERAVDKIFGAMRGGLATAEPDRRQAKRAPPPPAETAPSLADRIAERIPIRVVMDRDTAKVAVMGAMLLGLFGWLLSMTGNLQVGEEVVKPLTRPELVALSPVLATGYMVGSDHERWLSAKVSDQVWAALKSEDRYGAASALAANCATAQVLRAEVSTRRAGVVVIEIVDGKLLRVASDP